MHAPLPAPAIRPDNHRRAHPRRERTPASPLVSARAFPSASGATSPTQTRSSNVHTSQSRETVDSEQIWHVTCRQLRIAVQHEAVRLAAGDTLVVSEALSRQVTAVTDATAVVCGFGDAIQAVNSIVNPDKLRHFGPVADVKSLLRSTR